MPRRDVCFLTGPNMAGKSTYMKTLGMAVYLAQWWLFFFACGGRRAPEDRHENGSFSGVIFNDQFHYSGS
ncbi:putative mismatch repair-like protein [Odoribacter splanchnicus CAG:14]|nr:mismatch repair-like protein [Odoribacter splanchnicus]CDB07976.1 putative mismatch repair-like protein [Odoribacter splanchnicus CAG:14]